MARRAPAHALDSQREAIAGAAAAVRDGAGRVVLVAGDAGAGKSRLLRDALASVQLPRHVGAGGDGGGAPYGPVTAALRSWRRARPGVLEPVAGVETELARILPELGAAPPGPPAPGVVCEAVAGAVRSLVARGPAALVLDDLERADDATRELVPALAAAIRELPVLLAGAYRTDDPAAAPALRRLREGLRRVGAVEVDVTPLDLAGVTAVAAGVLGRPPSPALARLLAARTGSLAFFVEELAAALVASDRIRVRGGLAELDGDVALPVPVTVRDAVLLRADALGPGGRAALEVAAVAGSRFDLTLVADLASEAGFAEALGRGLLTEDAGVGAFPHELARDAVYADVPWTRRRSLHVRLAERLEQRGAPAAAIATQWAGAGETIRARDAFVRAADAAAAVGGYRDAAAHARAALDLWPDGASDVERDALLERTARWAELGGELRDAVRALREVVAGATRRGDVARVAAANHALGRLFALQGASARAAAAWSHAAQGFAAVGDHAGLAEARLALGTLQHYAGHLSAALGNVEDARASAALAADAGLVLRARILEGLVRGKLGETEPALVLVRGALDEALDARALGAAAAAFQALATVLENAGELEQAVEVYGQAIAYCDGNDLGDTGNVCRGCLAHVLRLRGRWRDSAVVARQVLDDDDATRPARGVAAAVLGMVLVTRGELGTAARLLDDAVPVLEEVGSIGPSIEATWAIARLHDLRDEREAAIDACRSMLVALEQSDDRYYAISALAWAATVFARAGLEEDVARTCAALTAVAAVGGGRDVLAALAHALGEASLLAGDAATAASHFERAVELHRDLDLPLDRAETLLRAGIAMAAVGDAERAGELLTTCRLLARRLGARPLAAAAAHELRALGRAPGDADAEEAGRAGLSPRQLEVIRLVAQGRTNREIADELYLSTRTVDMHLRHILATLGCRSRTDAVRRASELGIVDVAHVASA